MKKSEAFREVFEFINHKDGGHVEPYVVEMLLDYMLALGFMPPAMLSGYEPCGNCGEGYLTYEWEDDDE